MRAQVHAWRRGGARAAVLVALVVAAVAALAAVTPPTAADEPPRAAQVTESDLGALRFREIGPAITGGRISSLAVVETDPRVVYAGVASGGVWRTRDAGTTWTPVFDAAPVSSIGAVAVAPSDARVVWVGTGEASTRQNTGFGNGVYVSEDGGDTWRHAGLAASRHIGRIAVDPRNPRRALVAAVGPLFRAGGDRGLFLTEDAGHTWRPVLTVDEFTGAVDVIVAHADPALVYASTFRTAVPTGGSTQQLRWPMNEDRNRLYRSTDGGLTWERMTQGFPSSGVGRIALDIYRRDPRVAVAIVEGQAGGLYRTEDRGATWTRTSTDVRGTAYICHVKIDPNDHQRLWVAGADPLYFSADGGRTFCASEDGRAGTHCANWLERIHFDTHAIWIDPRDSSHMLTGNDGGLYQSFSGGTTWDYLNHLPLAQFHQIGVDFDRPYRIYGGMQDTGTWGGPSDSRHTAGILNDDWYGELVGDGYFVQPDPQDPLVLYAEYQGGRLFRIDRRTHERRDILPVAPPGEAPYRIAYGNHPLLVSPHAHKTVYVGGNRLFTSHDRGDTWVATGDLTASPSGSGTISALDESGRVKGLLWIGTTDGRVAVSRDAGATWTDVSAAVPVPPGRYVSRVVASQAADGRAYVTHAGHWQGDDSPYVHVTEDFGATWRSIAANLPDDMVPMVIREHPSNPDFLVLGTELGLWMTWSRGAAWSPIRLGLPPARIHDLQIHPRDNDLIVGTHGRGLFILDDIGGLAGLSHAILARPVHLFAPRRATTSRVFNHRTNLGLGHRVFIGANPEAGAALHYVLGADLADGQAARLEVRDATGRLVRTLVGPTTRGLHRVTWDLRHQTPFNAPNGIRPDPPGQPGGPRMRALALSQGPFVLPGPYTVRLVAGAHQEERSLIVDEDPRVDASAGQLRAHREAWHRLTALWVDGNALVRRIDALTVALDATRAQPTEAGVGAPPVAAIEALATELASMRVTLAAGAESTMLYRDFLDPGTRADGPVVPRLGQMLLSVGGWTGAPTPRQAEVVDALDASLQAAVEHWNTSVATAVATINRDLAAARRTVLPSVTRLERTVMTP